jgi:RNA polymerase sigma factor (TIGR02999 family)
LRDASGTPSVPPGGPPPESAGSSRGDITRLLSRVTRGDAGAEEALFDGVYHELRTLAHARLRRERADATLSTTGLVHEAYLKLVPIDSIDWQDRTHFFATAARAMRRVLIDRARAATRLKRGGEGRAAKSEVSAETVADPVAMSADELLALDEALERLGSLSERQLRVVELRFFAGLSIPETADVLGVGLNTVKRDWSTARVWLNRELSD